MEPVLEHVWVTSCIPYGDSDLIVRLLSRERGRIGAFARAAVRSQKRYAGGVQPVSRGIASLSERRGSELFRLEAFDPEPRLFAMASDPLVYGRAAYLVELVERLVPEAVPVPELFVCLSGAIEALCDGRGDARTLRAFELHLLDESGYLPDLDSLRNAEHATGFSIDPSTGAVVPNAGAALVPFSRDAVEAAWALLHSAPESPPAVDDATLKVVGRLFAIHLRRQGVHTLKSVQFLRSLHGVGRR